MGFLHTKIVTNLLNRSQAS